MGAGKAFDGGDGRCAAAMREVRRVGRASGVLEAGTNPVTVHPLPRFGYPPHLRRTIATVFEGIDEREPVLPDGSGRRLKLGLAPRSAMRLSVHAAG